jgi:hypothetical protein
MRVTRRGLPADCPALAANPFSFSDSPTETDAYLWSSVSAVPGSGGDAWAGGQVVPTAGGLTPNDDRSREPVLLQASCDAPAKAVRFRVPDPTWPDRVDPPLAPADRGGWVTSVAANATNDAWAATSEGRVTLRGGTSPSVPQRPRLYHLTDAGEPLAPRGDDDEARTPVFEADPPIVVELPPDPEPAVTAAPTVTQPGSTTTKRIRLKPAVYAVRSKVSRSRRGTVTLVISFRVRRPVTIGLQALRRRTVVSSTGLRRFRGDRGRLQLRLNRRRWPTRIRFVSPAEKKPAVAVPSSRLWTRH